MFISFLYMFWVNMCPSSGETIAFMRHLVCIQPLETCREKRNKHTKKKLCTKLVQGCTVNKT